MSCIRSYRCPSHVACHIIILISRVHRALFLLACFGLLRALDFPQIGCSILRALMEGCQTIVFRPCGPNGQLDDLRVCSRRVLWGRVCHASCGRGIINRGLSMQIYSWVRTFCESVRRRFGCCCLHLIVHICMLHKFTHYTAHAI
jgi:hypothetical protein